MNAPTLAVLAAATLALAACLVAGCERDAPAPECPQAPTCAPAPSAATDAVPRSGTPNPTDSATHAAPAATDPLRAAATGPPRVRLGIERLLDEEIHLVEGKRVGLVTNASGVDADLVPTADRLAADERVDLVQLYSPEHGLRGAARAGAEVDDDVDPVTGVPIESLYGKRRAPSAESLAELDVLLFDIQDVGSRTYTYISTLGYAMEAAAEADVPFVVLDRPNPQGGLRFEGPVRTERRKSFIGWAPLPVTHGMTIGELARLYQGELGPDGGPMSLELHVVEMEGWRREMIWEDTGLSWVPTSPNIPHALNAHFYVCTGMVAGASKNVDESAGFTMPFETLAATWIDPVAFAEAMNDAELGGVRFRPHAYTPRAGRFRKQTVAGVQLVPTDLRELRPLRVALTALVTLERLWPGRYVARSAGSFARIWGNDQVLGLVQSGQTVAEIEASWADELAAFAEVRARYLIYD